MPVNLPQSTCPLRNRAAPAAVGWVLVGLAVLAAGAPLSAASSQAPAPAAPTRQTHILVLAGEEITRPWILQLIDGFRDVTLIGSAFLLKDTDGDVLLDLLRHLVDTNG